MKVAIIIYLDGTVDIDTRQGSPGWASSAQEIFSMALFRRRMGRLCRWCKCKTILLFVQRVEELATGCVQGQRPIESRVNEGTRLEIRLFPISLLFKEETREITTGANLDDKLNSARDNCFQLQNDMALSQVCIRKPVNRAGIEQLKTQWERVRERRAERERGEIRPGRQRINNWQSELDESDFFLNFWSSSPKPPLRFHGASRLHPLSRRPSPLPSQDSLALLLPLLSSLVPSLVSSPLPLHCVFTYWNFVKKVPQSPATKTKSVPLDGGKLCLSYIIMAIKWGHFSKTKDWIHNSMLSHHGTGMAPTKLSLIINLIQNIQRGKNGWNYEWKKRERRVYRGDSRNSKGV